MPKSFSIRFADDVIHQQPASQFTAHPLNPKFHPPFQREVIRDLLGGIGWVDMVKVSKRSGYVLDGHERIFAALENGDDEPVPYVLVDVSEDEESAILATYDPSGYLAQHEATKLDALLHKVNSTSPAIQRMLSELAHDAPLYHPPPSLDDLAGQYGENGERDFWPIIRVQVSPETFADWQRVMGLIDGDEADKVAQLLDAVDETVFSTELS